VGLVKAFVVLPVRYVLSLV